MSKMMSKMSKDENGNHFEKALDFNGFSDAWPLAHILLKLEMSF